MSTLQDIEEALETLSPAEMRELHSKLGATLEKISTKGRHSVTESVPADVGDRVLIDIGTRSDWYDEMLGDRV